MYIYNNRIQLNVYLQIYIENSMRNYKIEHTLKFFFFLPV